MGCLKRMEYSIGLHKWIGFHDVFEKFASSDKVVKNLWMYIRFQQEEARIQAWESNEKAKAEAEMRKIEVYIFSMFDMFYEISN